MLCLNFRGMRSDQSVASRHGAVLALTASVLSVPYDMPRLKIYSLFQFIDFLLDANSLLQSSRNVKTACFLLLAGCLSMSPCWLASRANHHQSNPLSPNQSQNSDGHMLICGMSRRSLSQKSS